MAALAIVVLAGILLTSASGERNRARGYAEFTMFRAGCQVDATNRLNVTSCQFVSRGLYRVVFTKSLSGAVAVATRGTCCPGQIRADIQMGGRAVLVAIPKPPTLAQPVRASVFVP